MRVPATIASAISPAAIANQLRAAAKAPAVAQQHDDSATPDQQRFMMGWRPWDYQRDPIEFEAYCDHQTQ